MAKKKATKRVSKINKRELKKVLAKYGENPNAYEDFHALLHKAATTKV
jgi:hypothetical protein